MPVDHSWRAAVWVVHLLHRASRVADAVFGRLVGSALTPRQFVVLATVAENEGINQMAFIEATGIDRSSVAELVQRLVKQGLVQRRRTRRDARAYSVRLTAKGQKLLRDTLQLSAEPTMLSCPVLIRARLWRCSAAYLALRPSE
jgi:DNA-binding MarR family transcriptional regulator